MAERVVSTKLILAGEKEYRAAIQDVNREMKVLDSEIKLVDNSFKGQANTLAALQAKNKALNDVIVKQTEKLNIEKQSIEKTKELQTQYAAQAEAARKKLDDLNKSTDEATKSTDEYKKKAEALQKEISRNEEAEQKAAKAVQNHTEKANQAQVKLNDLNRELNNNKKFLGEAEASADGCAKSIDEFGKETEQSKEAISELSAALAAAGVAATLKEISEALIACVQASIQFESAMAGVAKTTDLSSDELAAMGETIKAITLDIPITTTEFAKIAEVAGQLGVEKENLVAFSKVMANLGVATNMTSEEAATMLAQFAAITGMDASQYSNLGSAIVALGNNFATNEQRIADMSQTLAGAGTNANISEAGMLALSTAVTSLGIEAGVGGNNMSQLIGKMQTAVETGENLDAWAEAAGMSAKEFTRLWGTDASAAILAFVQNIDNMDQSVGITLDTLGLGEQRMSRMVTSLVNAENANGTLTNAIDLANKAWNENNALTKEAETRYATTQSKIQLFKNAVDVAKIAVGDQLNPAIQSLVDSGRDVVEWATDFINTNEKFAPTVAAVTAAIGVLTVMLSGLALVTMPKVVAAFQAFTAVMAAHPVYLAIAAIAALTAAFVVLGHESREATDSAREFIKGNEEVQKSFDETADSIRGQAQKSETLALTLERLVEKEQKTAAEKELIKSLVDELNETVPELSVAYDEQADALVDLATGANMTADSIVAIAKAEADRQLMQNDIAALTQLYVDRAETTRKVTDETLELSKIMTEIREIENDTTMSAREKDKALGDLYDQYRDHKIALGDLVEAQEETNDAIAEGEEKYGKMSDATANMTAATQEQIAAFQGISAELDALILQYETAYMAAYESISRTVNGFTEMADVAPRKIGDVISALQSQIDYMDTYAENLQKAAELGVKGGLLAQLSDGSKESAEILAGIVADGGKKVGELVEKFKGVEEGKKTFSAKVAEMQTDFNTSAQAIIDKTNMMVDNFNQQASAFSNGASTVQGLIDGMNSRISALNTAASKIKGIVKGVGNTSIPTGFGHAAGVDTVPYDNYPANLHKGEMVLTALEAKAYRAQEYATYYSPNTENITTNNMPINIYVSGERSVGKKIASELQRELRYRGILNA